MYFSCTSDISKSTKTLAQYNTTVLIQTTEAERNVSETLKCDILYGIQNYTCIVKQITINRTDFFKQNTQTTTNASYLDP